MGNANLGAQTLLEAKKWLRERFGKGAECPCCHQFVKLYKRRITGEMAYALILIYRHDRSAPDDFIHLPTFLAACGAGRSNMAALLRLWGLIERMPGTREDGSWRIGYYRITELGRRFVQGSCFVQQYIYLYNQERVNRKDADPSRVTIREALGQKFNYDELMRDSL